MEDLSSLLQKIRWKGICNESVASLFFAPYKEPANQRSTRVRLAKEVCAACPVIEECAEYAIEAQEEYGVWGGMNEKERNAFRRRRR